MTPKSGNRFSEKVMRKQNWRREPGGQAARGPGLWAFCCSRSASLTARSTPSRIWRAGFRVGIVGLAHLVERFQQPVEIFRQQLLAEIRVAARPREIVLGDQVAHRSALKFGPSKINGKP